MKAKTLTVLSFLSFILYFNSCRSSQIGVGTSYDKGRLGRGENRASGYGLFAEYRWQKMTGTTGYGLDFNIHSGGYSSVAGDSEGLYYKTIQGKYYHQLSSVERPVRLDFAAGFGLGTLTKTSTDDLLVITNAALELRFPKNDLFYLSSKVNLLRDLSDATGGLSFFFHWFRGTNQRK